MSGGRLNPGEIGRMLILASVVTSILTFIHLFSTVGFWYLEGRPDFYFSGWGVLTHGGIPETFLMYLLGYGLFTVPTCVLLSRGFLVDGIPMPMTRVLLFCTLIALLILPVHYWLEFRTRELGFWGFILVNGLVAAYALLELHLRKKIGTEGG